MINSKRTILFSFLSAKGIFCTLFLLVGLLFSSCKIKQPLANTKLKKKSARFLTKKLNSNKVIGVEWFNSKAKINVKEGAVLFDFMTKK